MSAHSWDAAFEELADKTPEFYPGSNKQIVRHPNRSTTPSPTKYSSLAIDESWDEKPRVFVVNGVETEFFTVGMLARALGREAVTIRKWERLGVLPIATFQNPGKDNDPRGRRRLYTRAQVEGIVRIAAEEGMFTNRRKPFNQTQFAEKVLELFKQTA